MEPGYRRQGVATEVVRALFDWAHGAGRRPLPGVGLARQRRLAGDRPRASASAQVGVQIDDIDGEELVFELDGWPPDG